MARKLRVLSLVHNLFYGGDQTRLLSFARSYDRENFDHVVASIHLPDEEYVRKHGSMREEFASHGVPVIELANALANRISGLLNDPARAREMCAAARSRYEQQFTPELMVQRHQTLFRGICSK